MSQTSTVSEPEIPPSSKVWIWAIAIALVHVFFAIVFAARTPFMSAGRIYVLQGGGEKGTAVIDIGAPDELQHVIQVARLADGEPYPHLTPGDPLLEFTYQSHQPPLFYYLGAGWSKLMGINQLSKVSAFLHKHTSEEMNQLIQRGTFEEVGSSRDAVNSEGLRLRALNALIGGVSVLGVFALAFWGYRDRIAGYAAAGFAALLPMNLALSGAVSNDPLLICLCTWVVALLVRGARDGLTVKLGLLVGLLTGLAFLTKTTALGLIPLALVAMVACRQMLPFRRFLPGMGLALVMGGAWWMRNYSLYGELFAIKTFNEAFTGSPKADDMMARMGAGTYWQTVFSLAGQSFVGVFSYMDIFLAEPIYKAAWGLYTAVGATGLVAIRAQARNPEAPNAKSAHVINGVFLVVILLLFIQFNRGFFQAQARYIMPAIGPVSALMGLGIAFIYSKVKSPLVLVIWFGCLLALTGQALQALAPEFAGRLNKGISQPENASKDQKAP